MSWAKFDDGFPNNPKVAPLTDKAYRLHTTAVCYCARNLTDGAITGRAVQVVMAETPKSTKKHVEELHHAGLWDRAGDGYVIHDYLEYNPPAEDARATKEARKEAGRRGGLRSGQTRRVEANGQANPQAFASKQKAKPGGSTPSRPVEVNTISDEIERMRRKAEAKAQ